MNPWTEPAEFIEHVEQLRAQGKSIVNRRPPEDRHMTMLRERLIEHKTLKQIAQAHNFRTAERPRQLLNAYFGVTGDPRKHRDA